MTKFSGEDYVKVDSVRNKPLIVRIQNVKEGHFDRPELIFNTDQMLTVNVTNNNILVKAFGSDSNDWLGKWIKLKLGQVTYKGEPIDSVVVEPIPANKQKHYDDAWDDDIGL